MLNLCVCVCVQHSIRHSSHSLYDITQWTAVDSLKTDMFTKQHVQHTWSSCRCACTWNNYTANLKSVFPTLLNSLKSSTVDHKNSTRYAFRKPQSILNQSDLWIYSVNRTRRKVSTRQKQGLRRRETNTLSRRVTFAPTLQHRPSRERRRYTHT